MEVLKDVTFNLSRWMFAFKYLGSALTLPALFGGKPINERVQPWLTRVDKVMIGIVIIVPILGYTGIWYFRAIFMSKTPPDNSAPDDLLWKLIYAGRTAHQ